MTDGGQQNRIVALAGGVGGARMAEGLAGLPNSDLKVVVNTADDFVLWGLDISPDLDTVMYTLAGLADPTNGWGIAGDTHSTLAGLASYGIDTWFSLGDRDFATHILRSMRLRDGVSLTNVTADMAGALGISARILPMTDQRVATVILSGGREIDFQEYFVARRQTDVVDGVRFDGIENAKPTVEVLAAISHADFIVLCPSNPIVSIGPILHLAGFREALGASSAIKVGVSPIIGGRALKGPADQMLSSLGHEPSALGVARMYADLLDVFVIDTQDARLAGEIEALGLRVEVLQTIMGGREDRIRLANEIMLAAATAVAR